MSHLNVRIRLPSAKMLKLSPYTALGHKAIVYELINCTTHTYICSFDD